MLPSQHQTVDVLVVGAGLSGICAAHYLQTRCPGKSYLICEGRSAMGGTWDLFRYPGVRSDSDMHTLGYSFRPWGNAKAIADAPAILSYIQETAHAFGIDQHIRYGHCVQRADWSSAKGQWLVEINCGPETQPIRVSCNFLCMCTGYYDYDAGYTPDFPGIARYQGRVIHPQQWPKDLDYTGKHVLVIGSGATAFTLVPAMAEQAAHVTMLQRSPTYVVSSPAEDVIANMLQRYLPGRLAYSLIRQKNILLGLVMYYIMRWLPAWSKSQLLKDVQNELGPDFDVHTHFTPTYNPWDQRVCLVPDGDLFHAMKKGKASVITDHIDRFTTNGVMLQSGKEIPADIVVTATGLVLKMMGGMQMTVDGRPVDLAKTMYYKGTMFSGIPNLALMTGYVNASWTLKCELTARFVCRLLHHMDQHGYVQCKPRDPEPSVTPEPVVNFSSGYYMRALSYLPTQGSKYPWKVYQNYLMDILALRYGSLKDGILEFTKLPSPGH